MDSELIDQILLSLKDTIKEDSSIADVSGFNEIREIGSNCKVCYIDGGNLEIFKSAHFSVQMIRVYYTIYHNNKRVIAKRREFFVLIRTEVNEGKLMYSVDSFGESLIGKLRFTADSNELKRGLSRAEVSEIGGVVRRLSEIRVMEECIGELEKGDFIVLDGDLEEKSQAEHDSFQKMYYLGNSKGVSICGLAKTNTMLTDTGESFAARLALKGPDSEWCFLMKAKQLNENETFFVKLHRKSDYVFKFQVRKENKGKLDEVLGLLMRNSVDPVFLGYPYGLIEADRFARVENTELDYIRTKFVSKAGKWYKELRPFLHTSDSHEILDNIR